MFTKKHNILIRICKKKERKEKIKASELRPSKFDFFVLDRQDSDLLQVNNLSKIYSTRGGDFYASLIHGRHKMGKNKIII